MHERRALRGKSRGAVKPKTGRGPHADNLYSHEILGIPRYITCIELITYV